MLVVFELFVVIRHGLAEPGDETKLKMIVVFGAEAELRFLGFAALRGTETVAAARRALIAAFACRRWGALLSCRFSWCRAHAFLQATLDLSAGAGLTLVF